jgi:ELWxxDGT repeat protein
MLFFSANDGMTGRELWKSNGTTSGTVLVKDINPGFYFSDPRYLTAVDGTLFFTAFDFTSGRELWKSNGKAQGTALVKDINPGPSSSYAYHLTAVDGTLYFSANDGTTGQELWMSDGQAQGTVLVEDIQPGPSGSFPSSLRAVDGTLYLAADDGFHGDEPWTVKSGTKTSKGSLMEALATADGGTPTSAANYGPVAARIAPRTGESVTSAEPEGNLATVVGHRLGWVTAASDRGHAEHVDLLLDDWPRWARGGARQWVRWRAPPRFGAGN